METRKVQVTGGSTYTVSLPKDWATKNDVSSGSTVEFYAEGDLLLLTPQTEDGHTRGELDISDLTTDEELRRAVLTMYVSGFDVITLTTDRMTADQRRTVRDATQGLVGLEVIEEMPNQMVLQDLLDSSELSMENAVTRMRLVALTMLEDAVEAVRTDRRPRDEDCRTQPRSGRYSRRSDGAARRTPRGSNPGPGHGDGRAAG